MTITEASTPSQKLTGKTKEIAFQFEKKSELILEIDGDISTEFTVESNQIVLTTYNSSKTYILYRRTDITQETEFSSQGDFSPSIHEDAFDKLTEISQDQQEQIDRSVKLGASQAGFTPVIKGEVPDGGIIVRERK